MKVVLLALVLVVVVSVEALAEDLSSSQQKALESIGVTVYPGASFTTGDETETLTVLWFKSEDSPKTIMAWYKQKLSGWSELVINGSQVLYKGPPNLDSKELSSKPYIFVRRTTESGVSQDSEITIRIPK